MSKHSREQLYTTASTQTGLGGIRRCSDHPYAWNGEARIQLLAILLIGQVTLQWNHDHFTFTLSDQTSLCKCRNLETIAYCIYFYLRGISDSIPFQFSGSCSAGSSYTAATFTHEHLFLDSHVTNHSFHTISERILCSTESPLRRKKYIYWNKDEHY